MFSTGPITVDGLEGKGHRYSSQDKFPQMHMAESPGSKKLDEGFKVQLPSVLRNSSIVPNSKAILSQQRIDSTND